MVRVKGQEIRLHGRLKRAGAGECERHALQEATRALRTLAAPLGALEVTCEVKQALAGLRSSIKGVDPWASGRAWWRSVGEKAGLRVARRPGDSYSEAIRQAEVCALTGVEKLRMTLGEQEAAGNPEVQEEILRAKAERRKKRREKEQVRLERGINEYAEASQGTSVQFPFAAVPRSSPDSLDRLLEALGRS